MSTSKVVIVIPVYKDTLNEFEKISLMQVKKVLGKYPIIFVAPEGVKFSYFSEGNGIVHCPKHFFESVKSYSRLMLSPDFYKVFSNFDYMLIYQLDAFVFSDQLEYFCSLGYDYIGATWSYLFARKLNFNEKKYVCQVGNGGFCLRNIKACYDVLLYCQSNASDLLQKPEDDFWALCGKAEINGFKTPPPQIADKFSVEYFPDRLIKRNNGRLPFGCHGWWRFNADAYIKMFDTYGMNLRNLRTEMLRHQTKNDFVLKARNSLNFYAINRLGRRLQRGRPIMRYLARKNYPSIHVVRSPYTTFIVSRLLLENNFISDKIYFYNQNEVDILIHDIKPEKEPHLIIAPGEGFEHFILNALRNKEISYGNRVTGFHIEYLAACEKIFHNLGK